MFDYFSYRTNAKKKKQISRKLEIMVGIAIILCTCLFGVILWP